MGKKTVITAVIVIALFGLGVKGAGEYVSTRNEGTATELQMTADYAKIMAWYSQGRAEVLDKFHVAGAKRDAMDGVLRDTIEGRKAAGAGGAVDRNAFISMVKE